MEMVSVGKGDGKRIFPATNALMKIQKRVHYTKCKGRENPPLPPPFGCTKSLNPGLLRAIALRGPWTDLARELQKHFHFQAGLHMYLMEMNDTRPIHGSY